MPQKTHYQDDLFLLSVLVKSLEAGLSVEADAEYFRDRISGDIFFLDGSIRVFHGLLAQNAQLIERAEYLKLLERTARAFASIVDRLLAGRFPRAEDYSAYSAQFRSILEAQRAIVQDLAAVLQEADGGGSETDLVSQDELSELLRG